MICLTSITMEGRNVPIAQNKAPHEGAFCVTPQVEAETAQAVSAISAEAAGLATRPHAPSWVRLDAPRPHGQIDEMMVAAHVLAKRAVLPRTNHDTIATIAELGWRTRWSASNYDELRVIKVVGYLSSVFEKKVELPDGQRVEASAELIGCLLGRYALDEVKTGLVMHGLQALRPRETTDDTAANPKHVVRLGGYAAALVRAAELQQQTFSNSDQTVEQRATYEKTRNALLSATNTLPAAYAMMVQSVFHVTPARIAEYRRWPQLIHLSDDPDTGVDLSAPDYV